MNQDPSLLILQLEEEIITDKLKQGAEGLEFLLRHTNEKDMNQYPQLLYMAGVNGTELEAINFLYDSLWMTPEQFHRTYPVNFWIARSMNLQHLANICDKQAPMFRSYYINLIVRKIKEETE